MINKQISTRYLENGVMFQSHKYPDVFYGTTYEDDNAIWHSICYEPYMKMWRKNLFNRSNLLVILIDIVFITISILTSNEILITSAILFSIFLSFKLNKLSRKKFSQASKFHAAKHKVFNAWKTLNYERIPTLEESQEASHFIKDCSDNKLLEDCMFCLSLVIIKICTYNNTKLFWILGALNLAIFLLAIRFDLIQYLQVLSITKPTDRELRLVLDALEEYIKVESTIKMKVYEGVNEDIEEIEALFIGEDDENETLENSEANTTVEENNAVVPQADLGE